MFVIFTYDVNRKRVQKVMKICRKYLHRVQNSVFEGNLTYGKLQKLKKEVESVIKVDEDTVCIYKLGSLKYTSKEQIGCINASDNIITDSVNLYEVLCY